MTKWKYYNHAMVPDQPPHIPVETSKIEDGSVFCTSGGEKPMFARWTEGWDLSQETHWWYCIKDNDWQYQTASKRCQYFIRKADRYFDTRIINPLEYIKQMYAVQNKAFESWPAKYRPPFETYEHFSEVWHQCPDIVRVFGSFVKDTDNLVGYAIVNQHPSYAILCSVRVISEHENHGINFALVSAILKHFEPNFKYSFYINDGARNILHETNYQSYLEKYFGFHKAYCKLHIKYHPKVDKLINLLYPFRKIFTLFDFIGRVHQLNAVLKMEEICRLDKDVKCSD